MPAMATLTPMNSIRTFMLMAALVALFMGIGYCIAGTGGMFVALLIAAAMNIFAYWNSDKLVLRMHGAIEVGPDHRLHRLVAPLAARAGLPMPRVYLVDQPQPNAFATGRNPENAAVAATTGLLRMLDDSEVAAVMAHELAHVQNRDTLVMTVTATLAGAVSMIANWAFFPGGGSGQRPNPVVGIVTMIVAPIAGALVQMAISRTREYGADARGAAISGRPDKLASALRKLNAGAQRTLNPVVEANPAAASLYIVNPMAATGRDRLFSTHPSMENRIAALGKMPVRQGDDAPRQRQSALSAAVSPPLSRAPHFNPWR